MEAILQLSKIDFSSVILSVFMILFGLKAVLSILEWGTRLLGLDTRWGKKQREEYELLLRTSQSLAALQEKHETDMERSDLRDEEISHDIKKLTRLFVDKEIDDIRWEINNFAIRVAEGKPCNKDSYQHCIKIYEKYERILKENKLENGEVEISMELIQKSYMDKLKNGF
ncbi:MAG: hypothetical protein HFE83_11930 [Lachnospiraceae bacterium]|nr:hypothetical protein [Lachnospiraceae bacterium]